MPKLTPLTWALTSPPVLNGDSEVKEEELRYALTSWLTEALRHYLPKDVLGLLATPLLPDTSELEFSTPYLCRDYKEAQNVASLFLETTSSFHDLGASLHKRLHASHNENCPAVVVLRRSGVGTGFVGLDLEDVAICTLAVSDPDKPKDAHDTKTFERIDTDRVIELEVKLECPPLIKSKRVEAYTSDNGHPKVTTAVQNHLNDFPAYAPALLGLLEHCQVVMVLARALHAPNSEKRRHLGSGGMTFVIYPSSQISEELIMRLIALAQRVDALLGTVHFATAAIARNRAMDDALSMLRHSVGNYIDKIASIERRLAPYMTLLKRSLQGAVAYARREAMPMAVNGNSLTWNTLGHASESYGQTLKTVLWGSQVNLELRVTGIEEWTLDCRVLLLLEELARNLKKHNSSCNKSLMIIEAVSVEDATIRVSGTGLPADLRNIACAVEGFRYQGRLQPNLRGLQSLLLLYADLRTPDSCAEFFLGDVGAVTTENLITLEKSLRDLGILLVCPQSFPSDREPIPYSITLTKLRFKAS